MARLREVLMNCSEGDEIICTHLDSKNKNYLTKHKSYTVTKDHYGTLCIIDDDGVPLFHTSSSFAQVSSGTYYSKFLQFAQSILGEEAIESDDKKGKPRSIVDGDYSRYCTWDIEDPETNTSEWKPDTIREDIDIMESIRHACNRT